MKKLLFACVIGGVAGFGGLIGCDRMPQLGPATDGKLATASQEACGYVQNNYGQRVSWKQSLPVRIYIDVSFPEQYIPVVKSAAARWEAVLGRSLFSFQRATSASAAAWDGKNVLYWVNPWDPAERQLEGVTNLTWSRNQLVEADIKINAADYSYYIDQTQTFLDLHLESLLVHELGHFLGLKHLDTASVMLESLEYATKREIPTDIDKAHIKCEYN